MDRTLFLILLLAGVVIFMIGIFALIKRNKYYNPHCLVQGSAKITGHDFTQTVPTPVLQFFINGTEYKIKPRYKMVSGVRTPTQSKPEFWVDANGHAHYKINSFVNDFRPIANEIYPIGNEMRILYNQQNPKFAIVPGFAKKGSISSLIFTVIGILVIISSAVIFAGGFVK